ncbi:hypothetical protein QQF64_000584 [Cirrhinus molitorella]|uniref:Uncharacterized protein n=1 Tax=Cirrhinus molitorella TaxID=172907 RepID=A0ABR3NYY8_9TELE
MNGHTLAGSCWFIYRPHPLTHCLFSSLQGTRDPMFLSGVSFPPDWPIYNETLIKLSVYGVNDGHQQTVSKAAILSKSDLEAALVSVPCSFAGADLSFWFMFFLFADLGH